LRCPRDKIGGGVEGCMVTKRYEALSSVVSDLKIVFKVCLQGLLTKSERHATRHKQKDGRRMKYRGRR
jgi:hypothetical protein